MSLESLPAALKCIDLQPLESLPPEDLLANPALLFDIPARERAAWALKYSRGGTGRSYDEIGFRVNAANLRLGDVPLQTIHSARADRERERTRRLSDPLTAVVEQQELLRHRLLDLPQDSGRLAYRFDKQLIHLNARTERGEETWTFPLTAPLPILQSHAIPEDAPPLLTQMYRVPISGAFWLPLPTLIERGRFLRFQDWRDELVTDTRPGEFFCFVSHRWLTPLAPDPEGMQAAFLAWQLLAQICDAVRIAKYRGLHAPRMRSASLGAYVGIHGSDLAESLLVNLLRRRLSDESLELAWEEARSLAGLTDDNGAAAAARDSGLGRLREALSGCPTIAAVLSHVQVWYDYSCMPQPPRTPEDETLFRQGLQSLSIIQLLGHTVILLDEAEDYLSRGWCTLEALVADTESVSMQTLIGSARKTARNGEPEHYFEMLLQDRPHIVWRAVLDTEVLGTQTADECLARLGLAVTDPNDVTFIYQSLRNLQSPAKIHVDDSELFTGVYPLPVLEKSFVLTPKGTERTAQKAEPAETHSIDWTGALRLPTAWTPELRAIATPEPFRVLTEGIVAGRPKCHVAVIGSCEGESMLRSNWCIAHRADLEALLGATIHSVSWLAGDIAPVGRFICATLQAVPVEADVWIFVANEMRFRHCSVTASLIEAVAASSVRTWALTIDRAEKNLTLEQPSGREPRRVARAAVSAPYPGGVFRTSLPECLVEDSSDRESGT